MYGKKSEYFVKIDTQQHVRRRCHIAFTCTGLYQYRGLLRKAHVFAIPCVDRLVL